MNISHDSFKQVEIKFHSINPMLIYSKLLFPPVDIILPNTTLTIAMVSAKLITDQNGPITDLLYFLLKSKYVKIFTRFRYLNAINISFNKIIFFIYLF